VFNIEDLRTGIKYNFSSNEFRDFLIQKTKSVYENLSVTQERTNQRFPILTDLCRINHNISIQNGLFLVTALSRINNDKNTRYVLLIDGLEYSDNILFSIQDYVPVYRVNMTIDSHSESVPSALSKWFRSNMGRGFSFVDIDYFLYKNDYSRVLMIEEKASNNATLGYGQRISYYEMMNDVIKFNSKLTVIFKEPTQQLVKSFSLDKTNHGIIYTRLDFNSKEVLYDFIIDHFEKENK